jgi:hypothetical protein
MTPEHRSPEQAIATATAETGDSARHVTPNPYWSEPSGSESEAGGTLQGAINSVRRFAERLLGVRIERLASVQETPFVSYPTDPSVIAHRDSRLVPLLQTFLGAFDISAPEKDLEGIIHEYDGLFRAWPHKNLDGGFGLNPEVILESGCWRGFTTYLLDAASSVSTQLYCFDINLRQLNFVSKKAFYFEADIASQQLPIRDKRTVAFFDDHVSHLERLKLSDSYGIQYMAFDDDVSFLNAHSDGWPPLPTISMLFDETLPLSRFEWVSNRRRLVADWTSVDRTTIDASRYALYTQDELFELTGYRNSSRTTYVVRR